MEVAKYFCLSVILLSVNAVTSTAQDKRAAKSGSPAATAEETHEQKVDRFERLGAIAVKLRPMQSRGKVTGPRWSPKGTKVPLTQHGEQLVGTLRIGKAAKFKVWWTVAKPGDDGVFSIDLNGDGEPSATESSTIKATERRGSFWYSGTQALKLPLQGGGSRPYPISFWYVTAADKDPDTPEVMRWTRRGWMEGSFKLGNKSAVVVMTEGLPDGTFTNDDSWGLGYDQPSTYRNSMARLNKHAWLDGVAFRPLKFDPDGASISFEAYDPGFTEAEERERNDPYAADKKLARAKQPVRFETDLGTALKTASEQDKLVFVDFVTTWCGPCKAMDRYVYTAKPVVEGLSQFVAVQLDGDEEDEIVEKYEVSGYPTLLVLDADGKVLARTSGYTTASRLLKLLDASKKKSTEGR